MKVASVSHLKDNLSAHLAQVKAGETVVITERNRPIAQLQAIEAHHDDGRVERLIREGIIEPPQRPYDPEMVLIKPIARCSDGSGLDIDYEREGR